MAKRELFHISDVLSLYTGVLMSFDGPLEKPDGTTRKKYEDISDGFYDLFLFITGHEWTQIQHPKIKQAMYDKVREILEEQHSRLVDIKYTQEELAGVDPMVSEIKLKNWIEGVKSIHGFCDWLSITQERLQLLRKPDLKNFDNMSPN